MVVRVFSPRGLGTVIHANYKNETVRIENKTDVILDTAFGVNLTPTWKQYEDFLEDRCFPRTRDCLKLVLQDIGLDCYDPLQIIKKTQGRLTDDDLWLELSYEED